MLACSRRRLACAWAVFVIALTLLVGAARVARAQTIPIDGGGAADGTAPEGDAETDAGAEPLAIARQRVALLEKKRRALRVINEGSIPEALYTTELFKVDLRDEAAVRRRIDELARDVARRQKQAHAGLDPFAAVDAGGGGGVGDGDVLGGANEVELRRVEELLERDLALLRLAFLKKPTAVRVALLEAEGEARRQAREHEDAVAAEKLAMDQQREAEQAQRKALDEADRTQEGSLRAIANERARAEGVRASLAVRRGELSKHASELARASAAHAKTAFELRQAARAGAGTAALDGLYDRIVEEVERARQDLSVALDERTAPVPSPRFQPDPTLERPELAGAKRALDDLAADIAGAADALEKDEQELVWERAVDAAERAKSLNETRLSLLARVSPEKRSRTLGLGEEGREQFRREVTHLRLLTRWTWIYEEPALKRTLRSLRTPALLAPVVLRLFGILVLVLVGRAFAKRGPVWIDALRSLLKRAIRNPVFSRALWLLLRVLATLWGPLTMLAVLSLLPSVLGSVAQSPFVLLPYLVLFDYAIYRLVITAAHRGIGWITRTPMVAVAEGMSGRVLRSVHLVGRFGFALHVFVTVSAAILGRGYLHHLALRFGWLGAVPVAAVLISSWRVDIVQAYLKKRPTGSLAEAVRRTSERWYGFFVAALAFVVVLVGWVVQAARRFVLSFDQTRKALAYLFRKRLEREAGERSVREVVALPAEVKACLLRTPVTTEAFAVPRYPELETWIVELERWGDRPDLTGAWLIVGKTGFGKTSWLNAAAARSSLPVSRVALSAQVESTSQLREVLVRALLPEDAQAPVGTLADLAIALQRGPKRVVMLDEIQNLVLRSVGRMDVWSAFSELIEQTGRDVFWVCSCGHFMYEFLRWARRGKDAFRVVVTLPAWTEAEIRELLEARTRASGWDVAYDDLVTARPDLDDQRENLVSTAEEYTRLIWDYSEGAPRVAVQCWADSLVPGPHKTLRVRLFARPDERKLESLEEGQKFVLATVTWHENVSIRDATRSLRYSEVACEGALLKLTELGVLVRASDDRFRITTEWWPAVIRYLRRKHLIES